MTTNTIKATVPAFIYTRCWSPTDARKWADAGDAKKVITHAAYGEDLGDDYTQIGTAEISITLLSASETAAAEMASLNAQLQEVRAQFLAKQSLILERISKLQALESSVEV